jgi:hypothetical protein
MSLMSSPKTTLVPKMRSRFSDGIMFKHRREQKRGG